MTQITGYNDYIATKPLPNREIKLTVVNGVGVIDQKASLLDVEVIWGNGKDIFPGDTVYLPGDFINHAAAKMELQMDDVKYILVPLNQVRLVKTEPKATGHWDPVGVR